MAGLLQKKTAYGIDLKVWNLDRFLKKKFVSGSEREGLKWPQMGIEIRTLGIQSREHP